MVEHTEIYRFFLHLQTQPKEDKVLAAYSQILNEAISWNDANDLELSEPVSYSRN